MKDITNKHSSLREATASGLVICKKDTMVKIKNNDLPKGDLFNIAKASGLLAAKQTPFLIPHCHPISIESLQIDYELIENHSPDRSAIKITATGKSVHKTGIEMEMLTSVSITAITIYDLLKPIDLELEISEIKLLDKKGGKSDKRFNPPENCKAAILICSDAILKKEKEDKSLKIISEYMNKYKIQIADTKIVSNDIESIQGQIKQWVNDSIHIILVSGGTGLGKKDNSMEAVKPLLEKEIPGIAEAMRNFGTDRSPLGMLSRSIAGVASNSLIIVIPGSSNGIRESLDAILPGAFHSLNMIKG